jgi:excisionase family DNA binding protein
MEPMKRRKSVLTTGEVAKICSVAPRTVSKWFDQGHLRGYRIPGSRDRRIPVDQLVRFMRANNIPLDNLELGQTRIVILDPDTEWARALAAGLHRQSSAEVSTADSPFEAGFLCAERGPDAIVIDVGRADVDPASLGRFIRTHSELRHCRLIATSTETSPGRREQFRQLGFDAYLVKPFEVSTLLGIIDPAGKLHPPRRGANDAV